MSYKPLSEDENGPVEELELTTISETIHKRSFVEDQASNGSGIEDTVGLIQPEERTSGEYRDYEEVLKVLGFGVAHILLLLGTGVALSSDAVEVLSISFALPIIRQHSELGITHWQNGLLSSVIFIGMLIGGYTWGGLADISGRRSTLITSLSVNGIFGALSAFSPNFYVLLLFRFLSGIGVGGSLPVIMAYSSEFIRNRYRGPFLGTVASFWMIGALLCGAFAWAILPVKINSSIGSFTIHSWRIYFLVSSLPSLIGAVLFFVMPESPRFLLEVGKERKAIKVLKKVYDINYRYFYRRQKYPPFPVRRIRLSNLVVEELELDTEITVGMKKRITTFYYNFLEILRRSRRLFFKDLLRSTFLLLIVFFCLSFGSYGVTLWYPTYVDRLSRENLQDSIVHKDCNKTFADFNVLESDHLDKLFCGCPRTNFTNVTLDNLTLSTWWSYDATFSDLAISGGQYSGVWFEGVVWNNARLEGVELTNVSFINMTLDNVTFVNSSLCGIINGTERINFTSTSFIHSTFNGIPLDNPSDQQLLKLFSETYSTAHNGSCTRGLPTNCLDPPSEVDYKQEYFYDFLIAGSAFPGNVVSAIAVYLFRRSYWLAFSLLCSTVTVLLLFFVRSEVYAVVILCFFKAITIPGWNVTSLLVAEIYPTSLRTTASGVLLLLARIGAIIGTYVFGAFSNTDQISVPILLTAAVLFVSSIASLFLPKTNRKTALQ